MKHLLAAACIAALPSASFAATVTIDDFQTGIQVVSAPSLGGTPVNPATETVAAASAIGGQRTITNTRDVPSGTANAFGQQVQTLTFNGQATVKLGKDVEGSSRLSWDAGGADLVDGTNNAILMDLIFTNQSGINFTFTIGGASVSRTALGPATLSFAFADFAGVNFSAVSGIALEVTGPVAFDTVFENIRAGFDRTAIVPSQVPLPAGLPLLLAGLGGLAVLRRGQR